MTLGCVTVRSLCCETPQLCGLAAAHGRGTGYRGSLVEELLPLELPRRLHRLLDGEQLLELRPLDQPVEELGAAIVALGGEREAVVRRRLQDVPDGLGFGFGFGFGFGLVASRMCLMVAGASASCKQTIREAIYIYMYIYIYIYMPDGRWGLGLV